MQCIVSFSGGKDSMLTLHTLVRQGHTPIALLVMYNAQAGRSWFHGTDEPLLHEIADALQIPLWVYPSSGEDYDSVMVKALQRAKAEGAAFAAFGDIDVAQNRAWCEDCCQRAGIEARFPLWQRDRESAVREVIGLGYTCLIKCVQNSLPQDVLGTALQKDTLQVLRAHGADLCGENGEYHTVVVDGPLFVRPAAYEKKEILNLGPISVIDITAKTN